jgi:molybdopterin synthase sulfur carrier subunit
MEISVLLFGQLTEIVGKSKLTFSDISTTDELSDYLKRNFPTLDGMVFSIAVNKSVIQENTLLKSGDEVALLPPFSGG